MHNYNENQPHAVPNLNTTRKAAFATCCSVIMKCTVLHGAIVQESALRMRLFPTGDSDIDFFYVELVSL